MNAPWTLGDLGIFGDVGSFGDLAPEAAARAASAPLVIGLLNNAGPAAFHATTRQFTRVIQDSAGGQPVIVQTYVLPELHADPVACLADRHDHLSLQMLRSVPPDGLVISGAEPSRANLPDEPYWRSLTDTIGWARRRRMPLILSCLAAHAAVLQASGVQRRRLPTKCCGVFQVVAGADQAGLQALGSGLAVPHSRWHALPVRGLEAAGYRILTMSPEAGVDMFTDPDDDAVVHLNGHPEYTSVTLMLEYRRDVARFLRGERKLHPDLPALGLDTATRAVHAEARACAERGEATAAAALLPPDALTAPSAWQNLARQVFGTWLQTVRSRAG